MHSQAFVPRRRRTAAIADIEAVADGLRELRKRFAARSTEGAVLAAMAARQDLVDELLDYLENGRVS